MSGRPLARIRIPLDRPDAAPRPTRIGLLGGSFNPAHAGHLHVSREALARLRLDKVWWLVSPQNPLKPTTGMAPFVERFAGAVEVAAADPRIVVSDFEVRHGLSFTVDTLARLTRLPGIRFVWLIGADNLLQMPRWRHWERLFQACPVAVLARAPYLERAGKGMAAQRFAAARIDERAAGSLADMPPPAWVLLHNRMHPASSTAIRNGGRGQEDAR